MNLTDVPEVKTITWKKEEGNIVVDLYKDKLLLNKTASLVMEKINGINSVETIIKEIMDEHGADNDPGYIKELVFESIDLLVSHQVVFLRTTSEFDGWLQYE